MTMNARGGLRAMDRQAKAQVMAQAMWDEERILVDGAAVWAGVDEAGRGCLAGPVFAAAVVLQSDPLLWAGVGDSKALTRRAREQWHERIVADAQAVGVGVASAREIDEMNILQASLLAMTRALERLVVHPDVALIDGPHTPAPGPKGVRIHAVVDGDARCLSIAAASIVAKVERDRFMAEVAARYPVYGFAKHAGYGTAAHLQALRTHGPCEYHRRTFGPVRALLQAELRLD